MKRKKSMIILAGVLVVLAIVYFALTAWNEKQEEKQEQETEDARIYLNDEEELTAFSYTDSENEMHLPVLTGGRIGYCLSGGNWCSG